MIENIYQRIVNRKKTMQDDQERWRPVWAEIAAVTNPLMFRLDGKPGEPRTKTSKKAKQAGALYVVDPTGLLAIREYVSGVMAGVLNQARKNWTYRLERDVETQVAARNYASYVEAVDDAVLRESNLFEEAAKAVMHEAAFGIGATFIEESESSFVTFETLAPGTFYVSYGMSEGERRPVEFLQVKYMTARQMINVFGEENVSHRVKDAAKWENNNNTTFEVIHWIGRNSEYNPAYWLSDRRFPWSSIHVEGTMSAGGTAAFMTQSNATDDADRILRKSGYEEFPVAVHRALCYGLESYPVMWDGQTALGPTKELQKLTETYMYGLEMAAKPSLQGPPSAINADRDQLHRPGGFVAVEQSTGGIKPTYHFTPDLQAQQIRISELQNRIKEIFHNTAFKMLANERRSGTKAREVEELSQERITELAPILERFYEYLDPLLKRSHNIIARRGLHRNAPDPGVDRARLEIEYTNILHTVQKMQGIAPIDRTIATIGQLSALDRSAMDYIHVGRTIEVITTMLNTDPRILTSPEERADMQEARAEAEAQQAALQQAELAAKTAKTLSDTKTDTDNGLTQLMALQGL